MRRVLWAAALAGGVLASAIHGSASADPLILRCKGTAERSGAEARASWKYYEVSQEVWRQYDKGTPGWRGRTCASNTCEVGPDSYRLKYHSEISRIDQEVTIDPRSGEVLDVLTEAGVTTTFRGQCKRSEDPLPAAAGRY